MLRTYWRFGLTCLLCIVVALWVKNHTQALKERASSNIRAAESDYRNWMGAVLEDVTKHGSPANIAGMRERARAAYLEELLQHQAAELAWRLNPALKPVLPDDLSAEERETQRLAEFQFRVQNLDDELRFQVGFEPRIRDPQSIGYDFAAAGTPAGEPWARALLRFDVLNRVTDGLRDSGVGQVISINLNPTIDTSLLKRGFGFVEGIDGESLLRAIVIEIEAVGTSRALFALLTDLAQSSSGGISGRGLVPVRWTLTRPKEGENRGEVHLSAQLAAIGVMLDAPLPDEALEAALVKYEAGSQALEKPPTPATDTGDGFQVKPAKTGTGTRPTRRER